MAGKYVAALANVSQETTLALASLNFDFALFKVEAPHEYHDVGQILSKNRREAAENGSQHITARKLGALFGQTLPDTPRLIKAYGTRCSEIARCSASSSTNARPRNLFQDWVGADATSIWAAATSGKGAIPVHLLACMLARLWSAPEATAIWEEVIANRKIELAALDPSDPLNMPLLAASRFDIKRDEISQWDASARAWLSVADEVKKKEQTQSMLLMKGLGLPISAHEGVYTSVMTAWKSAMEAMERILSATSQSIVNGGVLAGLASWHLYPNVYVLDAVTKTVEFKDSLIPKKVLVTLGAAKEASDDGSSVHWSLPLAYMRYYGDPIPTSSNMAVTSSRLSMPECLCVVLGAFFSGWEEHASDLDLACKLLVAISDYVLPDKSSRDHTKADWLQHLSQAAQDYLSSSGIVRDFLKSLISRGQRRYANFLATPVNHPRPMFGLGSVHCLIKLINVQENKVAALRIIADENLDVQSGKFLIRYPRSDLVQSDTLGMDIDEAMEDTTNEAGSLFDDLGLTSFDARLTSKYGHSATLLEDHQVNKLMFERLEDGKPGKVPWEFATALKQQSLSKKRKLNPETDLTGHTRWTSDPWQSPCGESILSLDRIAVPQRGSHGFSWIEKMSQDFRDFMDSMPSNTSFRVLLGNPSDAAIFRSETFPYSDSPVSQELVRPGLLLYALEHSWINRSSLVDQLNDSLKVDLRGEEYRHALQSLAAACNIYRLIPGATVNPAIFTKPIAQSKWASSAMVSSSMSASPRNDVLAKLDSRTLVSHLLNREQTMACIANFENVNIDLDPTSLRSVMALSCGNSIYVSAPLICDPSERPLDHEVKHIMGNIGKPGLSLMIPPMIPKVRKLDEYTWTHINHQPFNGSFDDCYQHTSLHLTFTGYQLPVGGQTHGEHISDAFFVESVVSVFDRSTWVADLDILGASLKPCLQRLQRPDTCRHVGSGRLMFPLTSIDSWDEYLDRPLAPAIFRCNGNWLARLAIVSLNAYQEHPTILFPGSEDVCWQCVTASLKRSKQISLTQEKHPEKVPLFIC